MPPDRSFPALPDVPAHLRVDHDHDHGDDHGDDLDHGDDHDPGPGADQHHGHGNGVSATAPGPPAVRGANRPLRVGIGGPVGSGKTALVAALCRTLGTDLSLAVVTNDIYTTEDGDFLRRQGVLPDERVTAVQTGACPHTAIRDDIAANLDAVEELEERCAPVDVVLVESGGDNLTATFSYGLVDVQIFVIDVAGGDKVPRKGGPGVIASDLLVVNKTDLARMVGADLDVMESDAVRMRGERPVLMLSLREDVAAAPVARWVCRVLTEARAGRPVRG